jgi:hypothetical protein
MTTHGGYFEESIEGKREKSPVKYKYLRGHVTNSTNII